jgi:hypothetical protein
MSDRIYLLYQCAPSVVNAGRRANYDGGCLHWSIRSRAASKPITKVNQIQARCPVCPRRPRLSPKNITVFYDKDDAERECLHRNMLEGEK